MRFKAITHTLRARRRFGRAGFGLLALLLALTIVSADALAAKKVKVKTAITVAEDVNPDHQGRPSPVNIIVIQLASADKFLSEDFFSLYDAEAAVLGGDELARTQMLLQPGETREWVAEFEKETRFVGVLAAFRDIEQAQWRASMELPKKGFVMKYFKKNKLKINVDALAVTVKTK